MVASGPESHAAADLQDHDGLSFAVRTGDGPRTDAALFVGGFDAGRCPEQGDLITLTGYWADGDTFPARWPPSPAPWATCRSLYPGTPNTHHELGKAP